MAKNVKYHYFTEGETDKRLVDWLKTEKQLVKSGKSTVFNMFQKQITNSLLMRISDQTNVVVIFDTDLTNPNLELFLSNIKKLTKFRTVKNVILIPQCKNLEDEIVHCTSIKNITNFFPTENVEKFKQKLLASNDKFLSNKFEEKNFDFNKLWIRNPGGIYSKIQNESGLIKLKR